MANSKASFHDMINTMIKTRSFIAGVILAIIFMLLAYVYSSSPSVPTSQEVLALVFVMTGLYSGYYLGYAVRDGGESTYFLVGLTFPMVFVSFLLTLSILPLISILLPLSLIFSVVFVNSGTMTDHKSYMKFISGVARYGSQIGVLTFVLARFVSPVTTATISITLDVVTSGILAFVVTFIERVVKDKMGNPTTPPQRTIYS